MTDQVGMPHSAVHTRNLKSVNLDTDAIVPSTDALSPESLWETLARWMGVVCGSLVPHGELWLLLPGP